ncbi:signal peptidase I [Undibacterium sp.]|jgi:signal peptidase I|uniref:signal peptidase I n=1 Tax=Undibacterium sp. TaxID=1914977 RepID=UPI002B59146E|nr:signal peptidase I [Undibacterium sp.]HTD04908.1 signal peptidase I [Undibacterium sp.]
MNFQTILGNFALILFVLTLVTGVIWFLDTFYLSKQRRQAADRALADFDARNAKLTAEGIRLQQSNRADIEAGLMKQPVWIEYSGSFFPVIALVFFLRSFLWEPFKIPSSSMLPTLYVGDLILVNKYTYGIRLPVLNKKVLEVNNPQRGDVMVFKYPRNPSLDYIKRVVGVPGDKIVYKNKRLTVNGKEVSYQPLPDFLDDERLSYSQQFKENLTGVQHRILNNEAAPTFVKDPYDFAYRDLCSYNSEGFACTVPEGNYFMMGDNRDNSEDSRYWGFVPDQNIVGKAFFIWMNLGDLKRIGSFQ